MRKGRGRIVLIHLFQLGLLVVLYQLKIYYANHLSFMRNVSFYTKKLAGGPVGLLLDGLSVLLLLGILAVTLSLWRQGRLKSVWLVLVTGFILSIGFVYWQWAISPLKVSLYYFVSTAFLLAICGQFIVCRLRVANQ
ncbi:hypothetical protein I6N95_14305 [Vagococcus sp. BWB3-3]|uniref:Uncharacterized protein n=1 Tax=Vagococcus allomyrinae TaxID=2794353 RepID=A0A940P697_9ENTE|nr:hypothetical protein [Vagococcus allomyrinae]MBP1042187.1 hypothetical protein [Vagococcus allomyrinae]